MKFVARLFFPLLFISNFCFAQLAIVYDKDGYTNVRQKADPHSKVVSTIKEGQVFSFAFVEEESPFAPIWTKVNFPVKSYMINKTILQSNGEEEVGYIHHSRVTELESLPLFSKKMLSPSIAVHRLKGTEILIETQKFDPSAHRIIQIKEGGYKIDGKEVFAYYGGETTEIKRITFKNEGKNIQFPENIIDRLYWVEASRTTVFAGKKNDYYIVFDAADGSDFYNVIYCIKNNKIFSKTVTSTIP